MPTVFDFCLALDNYPEYGNSISYRRALNILSSDYREKWGKDIYVEFGIESKRDYRRTKRCWKVYRKNQYK